jgi:hypothetical protein
MALERPREFPHLLEQGFLESLVMFGLGIALPRNDLLFAEEVLLGGGR